MEMTNTRATAFGRVLGSIMEVRGIPAEPEQMRALAERAGFDGERFMARLTDEPRADLGPLNGLLRELELTEQERKDLAVAYVFETDPRRAGR